MKTCICCIVNNEMPYIKEWADYHIELGIDHIFIYEDYGSNSHAYIFEGNDKISVIPLADYNIPNYGNSRKQLELYKKFAAQHKKLHDYDWALFTDIDEFLVFDKDYNLNSFLEEYKDYSGVYLFWKCFNADGHLKMKPENVSTLEYYTQEYNPYILQSTNKWLIKSFVNLEKYNGFNTLHEVKNGVFTDYSSKVGIYGYTCYDKAWINHYFCKSFEDYIYRFKIKGNLSNNFRTYDAWFDANPEFRSKEKMLLDKVRNIKGKNTYIISRKHHLICGGNTTNINALKNILFNHG